MFVYTLRLLVGLAVLAIWQFTVSGQNVAFFSRPTLVFTRLVRIFSNGSIWPHIQTTLTEMVIGYAIGAVAGLMIGALLGRSARLADVFQPYIFAFYSIPKIALAPLFIIGFGLGINSKIAVVVLSAFFLVFVNTYAGMRSINQEFLNLAYIMGASRAQAFRSVILPAAAPDIITGLKTAVPYSVLGAIIGEFVGANKGLGYFILYSGQTFESASVFAGIIILVAIVLGANQLLAALEQRLLRWRPNQTEVQVNM